MTLKANKLSTESVNKRLETPHVTLHLSGNPVHLLLRLGHYSKPPLERQILLISGEVR